MSPPPTATVSLPPRYRVIRHVANGGMASVWQAQDELLGRAVAVKLLAEHLTADEAARRRFRREARAAASLSSHPNVVTIYDFGEHDGRSYLVMELMRGGSIADLLRDGVRLRRESVLRWLSEAGSALDAAHEAGVVHRDVKPANMLLDERGRLGIADFGIARLAAEEQVTQTGQILGTASYVSPEQALGTPVGPASDRYSLAVVAFELLTRTRPFRAEHYAAQARMHIEDPPPMASERDPDLPPAVDRVLARAMAKAPEDRFPTATAFTDALATAVEEPDLADEPTAVTRVQPPTEERRRREPEASAPPVEPAPPTPSRPLTPRPAPSRPTPPPSRPPAATGHGRSRRRWPAVLAVLLGFTAVAAIVFGSGLLDSGGDGAGSGGQRGQQQASGNSAAGTGATETAEAKARAKAKAKAKAKRRRQQQQEQQQQAQQEQQATSTGTAEAPSTSSGTSAAGGGGETSSQGAGGGTSSSSGSTQQSTPSQSDSGAAQPSTPPSGASPSSLNATGFARLQAGDAAGALEPLRQAVAACAGSTAIDPCGYALYNYGRALRLSGSPQLAVGVLQERLQRFPTDQRATVERELALARRGSTK